MYKRQPVYFLAVSSVLNIALDLLLILYCNAGVAGAALATVSYTHLDVYKRQGGRLYLLGSKPGVAEEAGRRILEQHPNIVLCGVHDGYFQDSDPVAHEVAQARPDLLFVCLGAPKQEKWIARFGLLTGAKLAIGLGGALDVFAGNVERAPEQWQKLGMEWAYRLVKEPKRIGRMAKLPLVLVKAAGRRASGRGKQRVL